MTSILAFETATEACSVAVWVDGGVWERFQIAPRRHAELALPWADELLSEAGLTRSQLDAIAVGRGPGAFTGVRLAIALAQGVALALDRPLLPVSTLAALALSPFLESGDDPERRVLAAIDARMGEVYAGTFRVGAGEVEPLSAETVGPPGEVGLPDGDAGWHGVGTGFAALDGVLADGLASQLVGVDTAALPRAAAVARLAAPALARGEGLAPERVEPAYLRNQVALTLREQQALRDAR